MATQSPFPWINGLLGKLPLTATQAPAWVVDEAQRKLVLLLNHVLSQESAATARLARQPGRTVLARWRSFDIRLIITPAGMFDCAEACATADLTLTAVDDSAWGALQSMLAGEKPEVRIEGDVQLAAEVNWLVDHVRWDMEDDLSRVIGDAPAHSLSSAVRAMAQALRTFVASVVSEDKAAK